MDQRSLPHSRSGRGEPATRGPLSTPWCLEGESDYGANLQTPYKHRKQQSQESFESGVRSLRFSGFSPTKTYNSLGRSSIAVRIACTSSPVGTPILGVVWQSRSRCQARILLIGFGRPPSSKPQLGRYRHPGVVHRPRKSLVRHIGDLFPRAKQDAITRGVLYVNPVRLSAVVPRPLVGSGVARGPPSACRQWCCPVKRIISSECSTTVPLGC